MTADRSALLRKGIRLEYLTVGWNSLEAVVAIVAGVAAGSIALVGFGFDSVVEVLAGSMLLWRLRMEVTHDHGECAETEQAERRALRFVGVTFFLLAAYVAYESFRKLVNQERPLESSLGLALAVVSLVLMPLLALAKLRVARALESRALAADAKETAVCSYLSFALVVGLGANALWGWWWADPVAALAMIPLMVKEGAEALRGESHGAEPALARCCDCCTPICQPEQCICAAACLCCC
jgi:divalent metal cation (Fe/Co/Zn/Cd) transporter